MKTFSSKIAIINGNPYVRPPDVILMHVFKAFGKDKGPIPVRGTINGASYQQSLVKYLGDWRLYVNGIMAKSAGLTYKGSITAIVGRIVTIGIEVDPSPLKYEMIPELKISLSQNTKAAAAFTSLTPGRKKEILRYFSWLKSEDAKKRNIDKVIEVLSGKKTRFMARSWEGGK